MTRWLFTALFWLSSQAANAQLPFQSTVIADFHEPWALAVLPDTSLLVTEKKRRAAMALSLGRAAW